MKQTYLLFLFILCIIHQNMLSQPSSENFQSVKQNYEGTIYVPFSMEQLSKISQIDDKTIRVSLANSKQTDVIKLSKGKFLKIHRANETSSGLATAKQRIFAFTIQLPVGKDSFFIETQGKTSIKKKYLITGEEECIQLRYFDNQGNTQKLGLDNLTLGKMKFAIDRTQPITIHVINYKGTEYNVTGTEVYNFHVMCIHPIPGKGNRLTDEQIKRITEAIDKKESFYIIISYQDATGKKGSKVIEVKSQYAWFFFN